VLISPPPAFADPRDMKLGAPSLRRLCFCRKGGIAQNLEYPIFADLTFLFFSSPPPTVISRPSAIRRD
jgi:hypothetical protein